VEQLPGDSGARAWAMMVEDGRLLGQFSKDPGRACAAYHRFVAEGMQHPSIWEALRDQSA
jgi:hypothetical protein